MRLLDRYLLRELLVPLGYCLGGFFVFWITFDLGGEIRDFTSSHLPWRDVARYYVVKTPELMVLVIPVALLLAMLYALTNLARHHELTAMRAAGIGRLRLTLPFLGVGIVASLVVFALNEIWVPDASQRAERIKAGASAGTDALGPEWQRNLAFHNERERRIWNIGAFNRESGEMLSPNFDWLRSDGSRRRVTAARAEYAGPGWVFHDAYDFIYQPGVATPTERHQTNRLEIVELTETPEQIRSEIRFAEVSRGRAGRRAELSLREISDYRRLHPALTPGTRARLETQFHGPASWWC